MEWGRGGLDRRFDNGDLVCEKLREIVVFEVLEPCLPLLFRKVQINLPSLPLPSSFPLPHLSIHHLLNPILQHLDRLPNIPPAPLQPPRPRRLILQTILLKQHQLQHLLTAQPPLPTVTIQLPNVLDIQHQAISLLLLLDLQGFEELDQGLDGGDGGEGREREGFVGREGEAEGGEGRGEMEGGELGGGDEGVEEWGQGGGGRGWRDVEELGSQEEFGFYGKG